MPLLEVADLHTHFTTRRGLVRAVDGVSFEVSEGETVGIVGESGCGKSVTALSLMRLLEGTSGETVRGEVRFDGRDVLAMSDEELRALRGREIAMVFQDPMSSLNPVLRIGEQVTEVLEHHLKMNGKAARGRAVELLTMAGIPHAASRLDDYPHQFSGGMRQRVMIAIAMACGPRLILADEITTALDVTIQAQILELLQDLAAESGTGFIMITHDLGVVAGVTQRVHVMYAGQIVESASTRELFANPKMPYTWGLLKSVPRLDPRGRAKLTPIEGLPPDLIAPTPGCRFEPRCPFRREICVQRQPELRQVAEAESGHEVRCWATQDVPGGGWLAGANWATTEPDPAVVAQISEAWRQRRAAESNGAPA